MADWRDKAAQTFVLLSRRAGITNFSEDKLLPLLKLAASQDRIAIEAKRVGFAYILDEYGDKGLSRFFNLVRQYWDMPNETPTSDLKFTAKPEQVLQCVVSLKANKDTYSILGIHQAFSTFLAPYCTILNVAQPFGTWYDLLIAYERDLSTIFDRIAAADWVLWVITKPKADFGKLTPTQLQ
jgi:hypothetical protein